MRREILETFVGFAVGGVFVGTFIFMILNFYPYPM